MTGAAARFSRMLATAFFLGSAAFGQTAEPPKKPIVAGRVVTQSGEPLRHATVTLLGPQRYAATSDTNGAFRLDGIQPGAYALIAQRTGYASQKYGASAPLARTCTGLDDVSNHQDRANWGFDIDGSFRKCIERAPGAMLTLAADTEMEGLAIRIAQLGVIAGKVANRDSELVRGEVLAMVRDPGAKGLRLVTTSTIGPEGEYTVDDLLPGRYYLRARGSEESMGSRGRQGKAPLEAEVVTYYPGTTDESKAAPVEVKAGDVLRGVDILMQRARVFSIRGAVLMPGGNPPAGQLVGMWPKGMAESSSTNSLAMAGAEGAYEFRNVTPGAYILSARSPNLFGRREVVVGEGDVEGADLTMGPGIAFAGTIKLEGVGNPAWPTVTIEPVDGGYNYAAGVAKVDSKGAISFLRPIGPVEYTVRIAALPPGTYVKSIRYGDQDALHNPLDLTAGGSGSLEIVLSANAAAITGKVTNAVGDAVHGALVTAWPLKPEAGGGVKSASTDQHGNCEIAELGPGEYFVAAWADIEPGLAESPEFLGRFRSLAATVKLEEGGRAGADLRPIPREKVDSEIAKLP